MVQRALILLIVLLVSAANSWSQKGINIEIVEKAGLVFGGTIEESGESTSDMRKMKRLLKFGYELGGYLGANFTEKSGLQLGLLYSRQGQKLTLDTYTRTFQLTYLKFPLIFTRTLKPENKTSFTFSFGGYYSKLLNYEDEYLYYQGELDKLSRKAAGNVLTNYLVYGYSSDISSQLFSSQPYIGYDYGAMLACGLRIKLTEHVTIPLLIDLQYGLCDIKNHGSTYFNPSVGDSFFWGNPGGDNPNAEYEYHNSMISIKSGLKFNF